MKYFYYVTKFRKVIFTRFFLSLCPKWLTLPLCSWGTEALHHTPMWAVQLQSWAEELSGSRALNISEGYLVPLKWSHLLCSWILSQIPLFVPLRSSLCYKFSVFFFSLTNIFCFSWSRWYRSQICLGQLGGQRFLLTSWRSPSSCNCVQNATVSQRHHGARHSEDAAAKTFRPGSQWTYGFQIPTRWKGYGSN